MREVISGFINGCGVGIIAVLCGFALIGGFVSWFALLIAVIAKSWSFGLVYVAITFVLGAGVIGAICGYAMNYKRRG